MNARAHGHCLPPVPGSYRGGAASGFSLIEVVLALGVISFALVGIMGLFPVAVRSALDSQRETRATLVARTIFADLHVFTSTNRLLVRGPTASNSADRITNFSLAQNGNAAFLAFDAQGTGVATNVSAAQFTNGFADAAFLVRVAVATNTGLPGLSRVQVDVTAPAAAPLTNRATHTFVSLLGYQ